MNRTKIEWVKNPDGSQGYTWNPITGCLNHDNGLCKGGGFPCYAYKLANGRLKSRYISYHGNRTPLIANYNELPIDKAEQIETDPFYPRFWDKRLAEGIFDLGSKPKGIFVCDMGELFGDWIPDKWVKQILAVCAVHPHHRFYLLTKQPQNLIQFSPFPDNCFVGITLTSCSGANNVRQAFLGIRATIKFVSLEPLLTKMDKWAIHNSLRLADWLIIGAQTKPYKPPKIEWVREIVEAADYARVPVFLKDNLLELVNYQSPETDFAFKDGQYRQEMPS